jgi:ferredoxin--NADP+ reductase
VKGDELFEIREKIQLSRGISLFRIAAPKIAQKHRAGQFIMLRLNEQGERIPLTIVDSDPAAGTITLIVQEVGKTSAMLGTLHEGDVILDVAGPLGKPSRIEHFGHAVCVGGGIGTAPVYPVARALKEAGNQVTSIIGSRTKELIILEKEMERTSDRLIVTTDDGSYGRRGFVTGVLGQLIEDGPKIDIVFAIGPLQMMSAVCDVTRPHRIRTMVSLNPVMVDGTGMCGGCRVTIGGGIRFACVDGPEFDGHEVDFEELLRRNRSYLQEEKKAMEEMAYHEGPRCYEGNG